ncbi:copper resistance protein B [Cribrihabitans pelagius]|uniref:copper resistance protein B n=1 Tax=Cribrihabitans pelagius TaxID=1765746 RepID=UPI003B5A493B
MKPFLTALLAAAPLAAWAAAAQAEPLIYGIQAEQFEYRSSDDGDAYVWDFDALVGTDELKLVWRSEGERGVSSGAFESLENQLRLQMPISAFYDAVAGIQASTPDGLPDRYNGVIGVKGLAPQWFEIDADLFLSSRPFFRFEAEYEGMITNRLILTPSLELTVPLEDDPAYDLASGGVVLEAGARLSYDLIDRAVSPYIGVNYEKAFGGTSDMIEASGEDSESFAVVYGARLMF